MDRRWGNGEKIARNWDSWHHAWESNLSGRPLDVLRDELCVHLQRTGNPAEVVEYGSVGCGVCLGGGVAEIGLIDVQYGSIGWVYAILDGNESLWGEIEYGIQDERQLPNIGMRAESMKSLPVFGRVVGVRWDVTSGGDDARKIAASLTGSLEIRDAILRSGSLDDDIVIRTCPEHSRWWIDTLWEDPERPVSADKWACYEAIAHHLLALPLG